MSLDLTRRQWMGMAVRAAAITASSQFFVWEAFAQREGASYQDIVVPLDRFVEQYMRGMNAPGMTLVLADRDGIQRVATYGFSNLMKQERVRPEELFQIGSISKSFVALCLLQLRDEGKLDLNRPILDYLPWFRIESSFVPITVHHLLTHSSGLPGIPSAFLSDPAAKHSAAYGPGQYFHYCNMGFTALGHLLWTLDGRSLPESITKRILEPLGMTETKPAITLDMRPQTARSYTAFQGDRPYPRFGNLSEAPALVFTEGAGCIASTPRDMGKYLQMLASGGRAGARPIVSEESFNLFSKPHIKAEEFGPTASYGYGIAVDTLDGHKMIRHTGGMVSFASALQVDLEDGLGGFASINAMQGYRPNPVVQFGLQLMRATREKKQLPAAPPVNSPNQVENAMEYAGTYKSPEGRTLEVVAENQQVFLQHGGKRIVMEVALGAADAFTVLHEDFARFVLVFSRADSKDPRSPVVEAGWGSDWYTNARYTGPSHFDHPAEWDAFTGHYRNESPWIGSSRVVLRKGQLMLEGVVPLEAGANGVFYMRDEEHNPEWVRFFDAVNGKTMRMKLSGEDLWRVMAD